LTLEECERSFNYCLSHYEREPTETARMCREFHRMITCHVRYVLDPTKIKEFEHYGKVWIHLVKKFGGIHHGYLLPSEGASNIALASFSFPSFAAYEDYRVKSLNDPECEAAFKYAEETRCFLSYERTFFRPVFE
jgi:hypothetical protein